MNVIIPWDNTRFSLTIHPSIFILRLGCCPYPIRWHMETCPIRWDTNCTLMIMSQSFIRMNSVVSGSEMIIWIHYMLITWKKYPSLDNCGNWPSSCWYSHMDHLEELSTYRQICNIRGTKSPNLNFSCLVLQMSLTNSLKPRVKMRMKM